MRWRIYTIFLAAASLARAGTITGSGAYTDVQSLITTGSGSDSVTYTDSFFLTIGGGTGKGFFEPIARVQNTWLDNEASRASVSITCGSGCGGALYTNYSNSTMYSWSSNVGPLPFTYGVAIPIVLTLTASNCCAAGLMSEASIKGFAIYDARFNQLVQSGTFDMAAEAPEPNSLWLIAPLMTGCALAGRRRMQRLFTAAS